MKGKLTATDWQRIEMGLRTVLADNLTPEIRANYEATLDRIQFHNKTGVYALKVIH
jgi:hypothetical protein